MAFNREKTLANAQKQLRKGNVDRAIKEYERLLDEDPDDIRSKLKLADLLVKAERFDDALQAYGEVAFAYAKDDLYEKAAAVYKQALRVAPEDPTLHEQLGEAYYRLGRLKDAVRVFHKAQKIYKRAGDDASQRGVLERMTQIDPDDVGLQIQLAERYEKDGLRQQALDLFGDAASALKEEGRLDEYVQVAERIIYLQPDLFEMRKEVVRIYLGRGDEKHALKHLQHCFKVNPQDIETLELLASTFHRLGSTQKSLLVYAELAALYERGGQLERAGGVYRTILAIDHTHKRAREFLGQQAGPPSTGPVHVEAEEPVAESHEDALDGIEFLDADDDEFDEVPVGHEEQSNSFLAFAEDTIRGLETDADLNSIEAYPEAALGDENTAAAIEISESSLEMVEVTPAETEETGDESDSQIHQFLTESDVFLKYGLLDRAEDVITKVLQLEPNNLGGRDQMRKLLERMGDKRGAAHQLVEMARITRETPDRSNAYLRQASNLVDADALRTLAGGAGLDFDTDALEEVAPEFIDEVSVGLDEVSSVAGAVDDEVGAHSIDLIDDEELDELLILEEEEEEDYEGLSGLSAVSESEIPEIEAVDADETIEDFDLEEITNIDTSPDLPEIDDQVDVEVDEISLDADLVDLDIDDVDFDADELAFLDEADDVDLEVSDDDAEAMFDELFGSDMFEEMADDAVGLGASELSESSDFAIPSFDEDEEPNHFGSRSLSQKFRPDGASAVEIDVEVVNNSSLELGKTYQDMGLFEEAIEEFRHALDDPDAAPAALYNIAVCHIELGDAQSAQDELAELSADESMPNGWREKANEKLNELTA